MCYKGWCRPHCSIVQLLLMNLTNSFSKKYQTSSHCQPKSMIKHINVTIQSPLIISRFYNQLSDISHPNNTIITALYIPNITLSSLTFILAFTR